MNQPVKRALGAALAVFAAAVLVTSATAAPARHAGGTLTFCSDITYPPEEFYVGTKPAGSDIDIGNAVAKRMGAPRSSRTPASTGSSPRCSRRSATRSSRA